MDRDAVRKHIFEEIHAQFETKLREAKRQKSQAEEELESFSEKWRSERRRLNSEIDRLESALSDAKEKRAKSGPKQGQHDPEEVAKLQAAAEEKLQTAAQEWETERTKLRAEITRLQLSVADLIERSNNPLRASQSAKDDFDLKHKRRDDEFQAAKAGWEQEKLRMANELAKLKQQTGDGSIKALEKQLNDTIRMHNGLERDLQQAKKDAEAERQSLSDELSSLREELAKARRKADSSAGIAEELREAKEAARTIRSQESSEREKLAAQLEQSRAENARLRANHEHDIEKARNDVDALQKQFSTEMAALREELKRANQDGAANADARLQEGTKEREVLQQQLQKANELIRTIRAEHSEEREKLNAQLEATRSETGKVRKELEEKLQKAQQDTAELQQNAAGTADARETSKRSGKQADSNAGLAHQLQEAMQQRNFLQQQVHQANDAIRSIRAEQSKEHAELSAQLEEARTQIKHLEQRLNTNNGSVNSEVVEQLRKQYDGRIQEMIQQKTKLTEELNKASSMLDAERNRFAAAAATSTATATATAPAADKSAKVDAARVNEEVARVEGLLRGLTALIDDPSTELSTVIRKNVERAEWDAYLKGILFSMGRGKKK
jgi:chromosome segregation ATPase